MAYSSRDGYGTAAVLVGKSSAEDESVVKRSTYANTDGVAPALYEVPVQHKTQYEVVLKHTTSAEMNAAGHGCYKVPASENEYDMVLEHRTKNTNALYGGVGFGSSSAASSLFYQYVPSKVSTFWMHTAVPIYIYLSVYSEISVSREHHRNFQLLSVQLI